MPISKIKGNAINDGAINTDRIADDAVTGDKTAHDIHLAGTEAARMPVGTTAERANAASGDIRFNSTLSLMEYYDGTSWKSIDSPPVVSSISPTTEVDANANITITGSNFQSGATVKFVGNDGTEYNSPSVTVNSSTEIVATTPASPLTVANEPYDIIVTNASGLAGTGTDLLDAGGAPTWTTASGNIGTIYEDSAISSLSIAATDPDGQSVTYSSSDLSITGVTLNSNGTITGTPNADGTYASGGVTHTFNAVASDGTNTATRTFNILRKWNDGSTSAQAAASGVAIYDLTGTTTNGTFWIKPTAYSGSAIECFVWMENSSFGRGAVLVAAFTIHSGFTMSSNTGGTNESSVKNYHTSIPATGQTALLNRDFINALVRDSSGNHTFGGVLGNSNGAGYGSIFQARDTTNNTKGTTGNSGFDAFRYYYASGEANNNTQIRINTDAQTDVGWNSYSFHNTRSFSFGSWGTYTGGRSASDNTDSYHYMPDDQSGGGEWLFRENQDDTPRDYGGTIVANAYIW